MTRTPSSATPPWLHLVTDYPIAQVIHIAAQLGLADLLAAGSKRIGDLADATGMNAASLARLLRLLAALGIVAQEADERVSLTPSGVPLRSGVPGSVRDTVRFLVGDWYWRSWGNLLHGIRTGNPAFDDVFGMTNFEYWKQHSEAAAIHDANFTAMAHVAAPALVAAYDFARFGTVADIGGGHGLLVAAILAANPSVRGILFDLQHVVAGAPVVLAAAGVQDRCTVIAGDFFASVPSGADAYVLKYIIHNWDDERAVAILRRCHEAMGPGASLLLVEHVLPERWEAEASAVPQACLDLHMLVMTPGGRERTESAFRHLLAESGFDLRRVIETRSPSSVGGRFSILESTRR